MFVGAIFDFHGFQNGTLWTTFRRIKLQKQAAPNDSDPPCRDPAFHETIVITLPLGPSVFKTTFFRLIILQSNFADYFFASTSTLWLKPPSPAPAPTSWCFRSPRCSPCPTSSWSSSTGAFKVGFCITVEHLLYIIENIFDHLTLAEQFCLWQRLTLESLALAKPLAIWFWLRIRYWLWQRPWTFDVGSPLPIEIGNALGLWFWQRWSVAHCCALFSTWAKLEYLLFGGWLQVDAVFSLHDAYCSRSIPLCVAQALCFVPFAQWCDTRRQTEVSDHVRHMPDRKMRAFPNRKMRLLPFERVRILPFHMATFDDLLHMQLAPGLWALWRGSTYHWWHCDGQHFNAHWTVKVGRIHGRQRTSLWRSRSWRRPLSDTSVATEIISDSYQSRLASVVAGSIVKIIVCNIDSQHVRDVVQSGE